MAGKRMPRRKDIKTFRQAYNKTKRINKSTGMQQGGIRL